MLLDDRKRQEITRRKTYMEKECPNCGRDPIKCFGNCIFDFRYPLPDGASTGTWKAAGAVKEEGHFLNNLPVPVLDEPEAIALAKAGGVDGDKRERAQYSRGGQNTLSGRKSGLQPEVQASQPATAHPISPSRPRRRGRS